MHIQYFYGENEQTSESKEKKIYVTIKIVNKKLELHYSNANISNVRTIKSEQYL